MFQFYPTPLSLASKALAKFKSHKYLRILEPSAGRGDLLAPLLDTCNHRYSSFNTNKIDCIEIDLENQAVLRSKGVNVIDSDFLTFTGAGMYSHIILNPPFQNGDSHLIKAFDLLVDGELVAILNAETIRNPHTTKRKLICKWIEEHGSVEFLTEAFLDPDTKRKTPVEVALIWLQKKVDVKQSFVHGLEVERVAELDYTEKNGLALRQNTISNAVAVFNAGVRALKAAEIAREEADYYGRLLGRPLNELHKTTQDGEIVAIQERFNKGYDDLKQRAWTNVLHSTEFNKYLSHKAYQRLVTEFEQISKLSFTESNIRGFLIGLVNSQGDMNMQMLLDCFDEITKYRPDNRAYYKGWKSNEKHRELAYRVKMTRFIIPVRNSYGIGPSWDDLKRLQDFDKTFAMLDGKAQCNYGLHDLFQSMPDGLRRSDRMTTDYFDVRWYRQAGTVHFYPRDKKIIDRLNRMVGRHRQWLPNDENAATKAFWNHYEKAETITNAMLLPALRWGNHSDEQLEKAHTEIGGRLLDSIAHV
ncbi:conserved hypothetical protein [Candidatus Methylobacter favarea]|uniref:DUF4942 domain-containing protein n=1 Tax=Candidatus Methylobacter favarea TaxID=2707345 RepID=A0A8S0WP89_9GAMM|nr:DUF4942 domain-containing protein [Candidatus Methylobacter favarea]CAA9890785.1 conserved hypothetical protein [Candidatus Methylobacter favarea]